MAALALISAGLDASAAATGGVTNAGISIESFGRLFGKLHVVVIHFPIGLLIAALIAEGLSLVPKWHALSGASRYCAVLGAVSAVVAALMGWQLGSQVTYTAALRDVLDTHRWLGVTTAGWAIAVAWLGIWSRHDRSGQRGKAYRVALVVGAGLVAATGHFGGTLVYGPDYYRLG